MLVREGSRPRGCHVRDYNEFGILLECTPQESPLEDMTLNSGDAVAVRFWDRGESGRGGEVRGKIIRIMENGVAIEYADSGSAPNERLLSLLTKTVSEDSIEAGSSEDLSTHRVVTLENEEIPVMGRADEAPKKEAVDDIDYSSDQAMGRPGILIGSLVLGVLGFLAIGMYGLNLSNRIDKITQQVALLEVQQSKPDDSNVILELTQRTVRLEETQQQITKALSETAGQAELQSAIHEIELELAELKIRTGELAAATAANVELPKTKPTKTEWVIHLATLSDPNAADRLVAKAKTFDVDVHKSKVMVNDKQMYRLSIKGISSRQEAEKLTTTMQQQLKLTRKPWIAKQ